MSSLRFELSGVEIDKEKTVFITFEIPRIAFLIPSKAKPDEINHEQNPRRHESCLIGFTVN